LQQHKAYCTAKAVIYKKQLQHCRTQQNLPTKPGKGIFFCQH